MTSTKTIRSFSVTKIPNIDISQDFLEILNSDLSRIHYLKPTYKLTQKSKA